MAHTEGVRFGILGAGRIAGAFADGCRSSSDVQAVAIASRDLAKAQSFAASKGLGKAYGSYGDLLASPDIDAVYVATPNAVHYQNVLDALNAGKHVLCEKPLACSSAHANEMFALAEQRGLKLLEGFPYRFQKQTQDVLRAVREGKIGQVTTLYAGFGFVLRDHSDVRVQPEMGPGSVWDVGVYAINFARTVMGAAPSKIVASGVLVGGIEMECNALLSYGDGRTASLWSSFRAANKKGLIVGTKGTIEYPFNNQIGPDDFSRTVHYTVEGKAEAISYEPSNGFLCEAEGFKRYVETGQLEATSRQESIENTSTAEAILSNLC